MVYFRTWLAMWIRWVLVPKSAQPGGFWHGRCAGLAREDVVLAVQVHLRMGYAPSNAEQKAVEAARARGLLSNKESANHSEPSYSAQRHVRLKIHIRFCRAYA